MSDKYELVLFDLDGTMLDTSPGIFNSVRFAERQMGFEPIADERLREFIGPPPKAMYMKIYGADEETALQAAKYHRQYGREKAIFEAVVYSGICDLLSELKSEGIKLGVSTLKSQGIAEKVLRNYDLEKYFDVIVGMDEMESLSKCDTIKQAIENTNTTGKTLMIGDSNYDYQGALEAKVDFLGVLYGFGFSVGENYSFPAVQSVVEISDRVMMGEMYQ